MNESRALRHLMDLLKIPGLSGQEGRVAEVIRRKMLDAGCRRSWMRFDDANKRIPGDYEIGNLVVKIPGTAKGPRLLLMGHMDTVPLCRGAVPVRKGNRIVSKAKTGVGADNRTACAALVTVVETLLRGERPHPPLTLLFTVGEEVGLWGARMLDAAVLGRPAMGFNIDSGDPAEIIIGAIGADCWQAEVFGRSAHAGLHPEQGISAALIASRAVAEVAARGYFGKVVKGRHRGTSNVGTIRGGEATNQVTDYVFVKGESRSHDPKFIPEITRAYREAFARAASSVRDHKGRPGKVKFTADADYRPFRMNAQSEVVRRTQAAAKSIGLKPRTRIVDGGLDANYINEKGIPTVTLGAGQHGAHTVEEYVDIREYLEGCRLLLAIAGGCVPP